MAGFNLDGARAALNWCNNQRALNRELIQDGRGILRTLDLDPTLDALQDEWRFFSADAQQQRANAELQLAEPQLRGVLPDVGRIQPAMTRFNPAAGCPKCGSLQRDLEWKKGGSQLHAVPGGGTASFLIPDKLIVTCKLCGFGDTFAPLDTPGAA